MLLGDTSRCTVPKGCPSAPFLSVRVVQTRSDLRRNEERILQAEAALLLSGALHGCVQVFAVDVLHGEEVAALVFADVVDLHQVRVMQGRRQARFIQEHADDVRVLRDLRQDALEHDDLLESRQPPGAREIDLRHPTTGQITKHLVLLEFGARSQRATLLRAHTLSIVQFLAASRRLMRRALPAGPQIGL